MVAVPTLQDAKDFLNIKSTSSDIELALFLATAVGVVEARVGPLTPQSRTETAYAHTSQIVLRTTPVLTLDSVLVAPYIGATPVNDTAGWALDTVTGVLRHNVGGGYVGYYGPGSVLTITYTAGRADVPPAIARAVLFVLSDLWRSQRGASPLPAGGEVPQPAYGGAGLVPSPMAMLLLGPYLLPPGVA